MRLFLSVVLCFYVCNGFLLETNTSTQHVANLTGMTKQFVTLNEFYETKHENQYDLNVLSHKMERMQTDSEKTLALLTSQIQQQLLSIENSFKVNGKTNDTNELQQLKRMISELEDKHTKLQQNLEILQINYKAIENKLLQAQNATAKLSGDFLTIQQLKTVHQLQDLNTMKQDVQSISSQTHSLAVNQQARNQDFVALYNQTFINQNILYSLGQNQELFKNQTLASLQNIKRNQNISTSDLNGKIDKLVWNINRTDARVDKANEKGRNDSRRPFNTPLVRVASQSNQYLESTILNVKTSVILRLCALNSHFYVLKK